MEEKKQKIEIGNLYDINKNLILQKQCKLNEGILNSKKEIIKNFIIKTHNYYNMILCNERKDYTVFDFNRKWQCGNPSSDDPQKCANCLVDECLTNRGEIRGIDLTQNKDAIEIWMVIDDDAYVYYFFPYDAGVIADF